MADTLGPVGPPWGRGWSPGPIVATVGAWLVPWAPCGCLGGVAGPMGPVRLRGGVAGPMDPMWLPWGRGWSPDTREAAVGAWPVP